MTVQELIDKLKQFPSDALVAYQLYSDYTLMDEEEIRFHSAGERMFRVQGQHVMHVDTGWTQKAQKESFDAAPPSDVADDYHDIVLFPGN